MEYTFGDEVKEGPLTLGLHKRGSFYDILTVEDCRITDGDFRLILTATRDFFAEKAIPYFHRGTHIGVLRHLLVREAAKTGQILVDLVTSTQELERTKECLAEYVSCLQQLPLTGTLTGVLHTVNDSIADVI